MEVFGNAEFVLLYDQHCPICRRSVDFLLRQKGAGRLRPLPLQTPGILARYGIDEDAAMREIHVIGRDGRITVGADGVLRALAALPRWRWVGLLHHIPPALWVGRRVYRYIAANRKRDLCEEGTCRL
jgi:predicted DCC family thiol-disulfide oxidoreductase YuxK